MLLLNRYVSNSTASEISKMVELVSVGYTSITDDMSKHVVRLAVLIGLLANMGLTVDKTLDVGLLLV